MGVGVRSGNYRLRTVWTPEMDRYFVDLMLEQIGKENRTDDHLFSKKSWNRMTAMFNAKFNSKYEKDVLKNRHKILRNLYRALKNLLAQKGFRWDESRKMVTADNGVWDDYIQARPDARPYRAKIIPYYSDLCYIYGNAGIGDKGAISGQKAKCNGNMPQADVASLVEGQNFVHTNVNDEKACCHMFESTPSLGDNMTECSCASEMATEFFHDIMINEDYGISVSKGMANETYQFQSDTGPNRAARTRTCWQPPMDRYFIDLMLFQVNKGNHVDGLLRKQAWREMISSFNAKFGFNYSMHILKNRYKTLRRQHNVIKNLLELDGFGWDEARQMVIADDHVWQNYIQEHTNARQYMTRPIPHFEDLCFIFGELDGDNKDSISSHQNKEVLEEGPEVKLVTANKSPATSATSHDLFHKEGDSWHSDCQMSKRPLEIPPTTGSSKKSRKEDEGEVHSIQEMATGIPSLAYKRNEEENLDSVPVELVVAAIQALPDMDEDLVLDACDFLEDEKKAKTFLALDVKLRNKWLRRKLRPSQ